MANTITTGELAKHFGIGLNADFVKDDLEIEPAEIARAGHPRWHVHDIPAIGEALAAHISGRANAAFKASAPKPAKKTASKPPVDEDDDL